MSAQRRLEALRKNEAHIDTLISSNEYYEALRLTVTLSNRYLGHKCPYDALNITYRTLLTLLSVDTANNTSSVAIGCLDHYISILERGNIIISDNIATQLKDIVTHFPVHYTTPTDHSRPKPIYENDESSRAISTNKILEWCHKQLDLAEARQCNSSSDDSSTSTTTSPIPIDNDFILTPDDITATIQSIHSKVAVLYYKSESYPLGNYHFILARNPIAFAMKIHTVLVSYTMVQRSICITSIIFDTLILCSVLDAEKFYAQIVGKYYDDNDTISMILKNLVGITLYMCFDEDYKAYNVLKTTYKEILEQYPNFKIQLKQIAKLYNLYPPQRQQPNLLSMLFNRQ